MRSSFSFAKQIPLDLADPCWPVDFWAFFSNIKKKGKQRSVKLLKERVGGVRGKKK
jgi:hypothetical protein